MHKCFTFASPSKTKISWGWWQPPWVTSHRQASSAIHCIKLNDGTLLTDPWKKIYKFFPVFMNVSINHRLNWILMQWKTFLRIWDYLNNLSLQMWILILMRLKEVISLFPNKKSAEPDGFNIEFFKVLCSALNYCLFYWICCITQHWTLGYPLHYMMPIFHISLN